MGMSKLSIGLRGMGMRAVRGCGAAASWIAKGANTHGPSKQKVAYCTQALAHFRRVGVDRLDGGTGIGRDGRSSTGRVNSGCAGGSRSPI